MVNARVEIKGTKETAQALNRLAFSFDEAMKRVVEKGTILVANEAKQGFNPPDKLPARLPRPTQRTGNLRNSINTTKARATGAGRFSASVGPTVVHGRRVELGYSGGAGPGHQMTRKFPYLAPGFNRAKPKLEALYRRELEEVLR